jgi:hypothetical protein
LAFSDWARRARHVPIVRIVLATACVVGPAVALRAVLSLLALPAPVLAYASTLGATVIGALGYMAYVRGVEARELTEFGRAGALRELALGVLLGLALFVATVSSLALAGAFQLQSYGGWASVARPLVGALMAAVLEEILFRGVLFRIVEQSLGTWRAVGISALLFGALHVLSPNPTWLGLVAIVFEAGILLAGAFVLTRRLWLPIGLHLAWNFAEGGIFGLAVSGSQSRGGLLRGVLTGPTWLTGGAFGAEASAVAIGWCLIAASVLFVLAARKGQIVAPRWRAGAAPA